MDLQEPLVSSAWLADHLNDEKLKVVDGSWRMPGMGSAQNGFNKRHIPGAVFFDIDEIADQQSDLPHMAPTIELFEQSVGAMGICDKDVAIIYDDQGLFSAARVWWTFKAMGHQKVAVLDGGLPKWLSEKRPITDTTTKPMPVQYIAKPLGDAIRTAADIREAIGAGQSIILDARPAERFAGDAPEPREGLRQGHIPGSLNLPHSRLLNPDGTLRKREEIATILASLGVRDDKAVIATCGSGVTAAVLCLALEYLGRSDHSLYDGSWAEWGKEDHADNRFPIATDES